MFKKQFKLSTSHTVSGKDRKSLRANLSKMGYAESTPLPDDTQIDKLAGQKMQLLTYDNRPLFFAPDGVSFTNTKSISLIMPSLYTLFDM